MVSKIITRVAAVVGLWLQPIPRRGADVVDWVQIGIVGLGLIVGAGIVEAINSTVQQFLPTGLGWLPVVLGALLILGFIASVKQQSRLDEYTTKSIPGIVLDGFLHVPFQEQERIRMSLVDGKPARIREPRHIAEFWLARFVNEPPKPSVEAAATCVSARIFFFDEAQEQMLLQVRDGRWRETPELEAGQQEVKCIDLSASGESGLLNIATRDYEDSVCYGWDNHGTVQTAQYEGLPPGTYQVCVQIQVANEGANPRLFWFTLINHGDALELVERAGYENNCSRQWMAMKRSVPDMEESQPQ